jgi:hypothetical protein
MPAKTRSGQAGVGLGVGEALGETVGDGTGDRVGPADGEPQAELTAITRRRMATSAPRCLSDDFFMAWPST